MKNKLKNSLNVLFPENFTCDFCGTEIFNEDYTSLCKKCFQKLPFTVGRICKKCGGKLYAEELYCLHCKSNKQAYDIARAPFWYEGIVSQQIKYFKYDNKRYLAKIMGYYMAMEFAKANVKIDVIVPVPLHTKRIKKRGFNQALLLANEISKIINVPVDSTSLTRIKVTKFQTRLNYEERQENLDNAFLCQENAFKNKRVLLVDDVFTTGSTLSHCSNALKDVGKSTFVFAITFAHTDVQYNQE